MTELEFKPRPSCLEPSLYHDLQYATHLWLHVLWANQTQGRALGTDESVWLTWGKKAAYCLPLGGASSGQAMPSSNVARSQAWETSGNNIPIWRCLLIWAGNLALVQIWVQTNNRVLTCKMDFCITELLSCALFPSESVLQCPLLAHPVKSH